MTASGLCISLIKRFEGLRLHSYRDPVGIWTVGYGTTHGVEPNQTITEDQADVLLRNELQHVAGVLTAAVRVPVTQNQFDAMCSWAYNVGCGNATKSTLMAKLNAGDKEGAAAEFVRWSHAGTKELEGLKERRLAEAALFLS